MIARKLENSITTRFFKGKAIILTGPRQVGKTTLMKNIVSQESRKTRWFNGDEPDVRDLFSNASSDKLRAAIGDAVIVVIDEAQRITNIGLAIKLIVDSLPGIQVIATGSSALGLADTINEPLTGRKYEFRLYPLSFIEMTAHTGIFEERRLLEHRMIYGYYPQVVTNEGHEQELLQEICSSYLYKDILAWQQMRKPAILENLLQALALQVGNEVSYNEISNLIGADFGTVERYVDLLEKAFVIFKLPSLSRNMRNEIKNGRKIYFYDTGIRNALIKNFNPLSLRQDTGALWENFCIMERMKSAEYSAFFANRYFWRTRAQQEIDYIEDRNGKLSAVEFKWNPKKKAKTPSSFLGAYPNSQITVVHPENFSDFLSIDQQAGTAE